MTDRKLEYLIKKAFMTGISRTEFGLLRKESIRRCGVEYELPLAGLVIEGDSNPAGDWVVVKGSVSSQHCTDLYGYINSRPCRRREKIYAYVIGFTSMGGSYVSIVFSHIPHSDSIVIRGNKIFAI